MHLLSYIYIYSCIYIAYGHGDPHYTTLDGVYYDFQGEGDFTLFETSLSSFLIQGRMIRFDTNNDRAPTWHIGLAFGDDNGAFEVRKFNVHARLYI